jgi:hypothetical protein
MRLYLDDDIAGQRLTQLLGKAGHDVRVPAQVGLSGADDAVHLTRAILEDRVCLSRNHRHFENLHNLIAQAKGHHPGICIVRSDNNPRRDLSNGGIVRAIGKLLSASVPIIDQFIILNHWR